jgi:hypothetical protein
MSHDTCDKAQEPEVSQMNQSWFHGKLDIEEGGIERVTDDQRQQNTTKFWNAATFWYDLTSLIFMFHR